MGTTEEHAHRITIKPSAAHVQISRDGVVLADTRRAVALNEGRLPTRYYVPAEDVSMDLLMPTDSSSHCPFKGDASYWSARLNGDAVEDVAWSYPDPIESAREIAGLICFYNEKVDIDVDGERSERPQTQ